MIFSYPDIEGYFDTECGKVIVVVIENQPLFSDLIRDIYSQIGGLKGKAVLSTGGGQLLDFQKNAELLSTFIPFDINQKALTTKMTGAIEKEALNPYNYEATMHILADIERYLDSLTEPFDCNFNYSKLSASALIKSAGIEIVDDYTTLSEKLIDFMEFMREFDKDKVYFTVNLRSYIEDKEAEEFMTTVILHDFKVIMFENKDYNRLKHELRRTIDEDLCVF